MTIRSGDSVFSRNGEPAIVKDRDPTTGNLRLDRDGSHVREMTRHGFINGLDPTNRQELYGILDEIKQATEDPAERIELIRGRLALLEQDPKNFRLTQYLRAEVNHFISAYGLKPREYSMDETKIRNT